MPTRPDADPAIKYQTDIDLTRRNSSHTLLHELAVSSGTPGLSILEVGCSSGYLGASLEAKGHRVTGIEPDPVAADAAARVLHSVWRGGLEAFLEAHPDARFDVLLLGDVLEHMVDPVATLRRALAHLAPGGSVAISLPNVAHGAVRAMLLEGRFDYADRGLLDRTHLHFFTRRGIARFLAETGLSVEKMYEVILPIAFVDAEYAMGLARESMTAVELLDPDASRHAFQYVLLARPSPLPFDALLAANEAMPAEAVEPKPRPRGARSFGQRMQVRLFRWLLRRISARRFRAT